MDAPRLGNLNSSSSFLNLNWDHSMGAVCNSGNEIPPRTQTLLGDNGNGNACIGPTLSILDNQIGGKLAACANSMAAPFPAIPGFAERAAKFSCLGSRTLGGVLGQFGMTEAELADRYARRVESGMLPATFAFDAGGDAALPDVFEADVPSSSAAERKHSRFCWPSIPDNAELCVAAGEESSAPGQKGRIANGGDTASRCRSENGGRKRSAASKCKIKDPPSPSASDTVAKKSKSEEPISASAGTGARNGDDLNTKGEEDSENGKPPEPPKDYIHVRARRGQATDSHSLAERVRREKISERMKLLQGLVPGCNKVSGKAVMLDEIINYVQSLQHQVEFLSMKLATVNPQLDFDIDNILPRDVCNNPRVHAVYPLGSPLPTTLAYAPLPHLMPLASMESDGTQAASSENPLEAAIRCALTMQPATCNGYADDQSSQLASLWEDDLQSLVQMGLSQNSGVAVQCQEIHGNAKMEL